MRFLRRKDIAIADQQFSTISEFDRSNLGITKENFRSDFLEEFDIVRRGRSKRRI